MVVSMTDGLPTPAMIQPCLCFINQTTSRVHFMNVISNTCEMDYSLLLLIFTSAVFEQTWCLNNSNNSISTTFSPLPTTVTTQSLLCENKGITQNGICFCPDDWTGTTCNIPNFCPENTFTATMKLTFPKTVLGQFASSVERCPSETTNAGMHHASALCNLITRLFSTPKILNCSLTLDTIHTWISGATLKKKQDLSSSTQILTSIPERLTPHNITNAAKITQALLSDPQTTDIAVSAVATVSQLLSASHEKYSSVDHEAISQLTQTLQTLSLREKPNPLLVQPNMAVQAE
ncbi:adhesion G-protein coupled receptor G7-like [Onychostoma macrolepis]|uniref:adhesion G-protein coupled receptor G7-like n=1 Tax=Onychostoma macrolepis TaxID=369639 RepID=UPI00272C557C|nr:adhesion G-protein coupled receptor G7-like [Onychostoma macrolepis]